MPLIECPACGQVIDADLRTGTRIRCPMCGKPFDGAARDSEPFREASIRVAPDKVVPAVIENWDRLDEKMIGALDHQLARAGFVGPDRELLYALRVSKTVSQIKHLQTLGSRWSVAYYRPMGNCRGILSALGSPNAVLVERFLSRLYGLKFVELTAPIIKKALKSANSARSEDAKGNALEGGCRKIVEATSFDYCPPVIWGYAQKVRLVLDEDITAAYMGDEEPVSLDLALLRMAVDAEVWHLLFPDGKRFGPISEAEVMGRALPELSQEGITVWREGMTGWMPIEEVADFADFIDDVLSNYGRPKPPRTSPPQ